MSDSISNKKTNNFKTHTGNYLNWKLPNGYPAFQTCSIKTGK